VSRFRVSGDVAAIVGVVDVAGVLDDGLAIARLNGDSVIVSPRGRRLRGLTLSKLRPMIRLWISRSPIRGRVVAWSR